MFDSGGGDVVVWYCERWFLVVEDKEDSCPWWLICEVREIAWGDGNELEANQRVVSMSE